jgi:hypothetical protein
MATEIELFESPDLTPLGFCLWIWMKSKFFERNMNTQGELFTRVFDVVAPLIKC